MSSVKIGNRVIGESQKIFFIAEIGINHNGSLDMAINLIDTAIKAGCDAVKFQKRTIDVVYSEDELSRPRESPFGKTNGDLKRGLEFGPREYREINRYCHKKGIPWFASCWDEGSVDFIEKFNPPCYKISSASITDIGLLKHTASKGRPIIMSTGMSDDPIIERAIEAVGRENLILMHSVSTYPAKDEELNLLAIPAMKNRYKLPIGYSGHEVGIFPVLAAAVLGACTLERHITLGRAMWGSDQAASVEPQGLEKIISYLREWEQIKGDGIKKILPSEALIMKKLRRK